jgi:protein-disulfide isomerase
VAKVTPKKQSNTGFLVVLGVVAAVGGALIWSRVQDRPAPIELPANTTVQAEGYLRGDPNAPISIIEFADFECPGCGQFAMLQGPDIKSRIIDAGLANFRFYDFPLTQIHANTLMAHLSAACASDQGKFWEMHDQLFANQPDWASQVTNNPLKFMQGYAQAIGLDMAMFNECVKSQKHMGRISANAAEGNKLGVNSTPTLMINNRLYPGALSYDAIRKIVDSLRAVAPAAPAAGSP